MPSRVAARHAMTRAAKYATGKSSESPFLVSWMKTWEPTYPVVGLRAVGLGASHTQDTRGGVASRSSFETDSYHISLVISALRVPHSSISSR